MQMKIVVGLIERVKVCGTKASIITLAKFDTGAKWCSIDKKLASKIGVKFIKLKKLKSALGKQRRRLVEFELEIYGRKFKVKGTIADRSKLVYPVLIGRNIIFRNFIVDVEKTNKSPDESDLRDELKDDLKKLKRLKKSLGHEVK